jgi:hypothetical protein
MPRYGLTLWSNVAALNVWKASKSQVPLRLAGSSIETDNSQTGSSRSVSTHSLRDANAIGHVARIRHRHANARLDGCWVRARLGIAPLIDCRLTYGEPEPFRIGLIIGQRYPLAWLECGDGACNHSLIGRATVDKCGEHYKRDDQCCCASAHAYLAPTHAVAA